LRSIPVQIFRASPPGLDLVVAATVVHQVLR
jgi:hypothetical protein